MWFQGGVLRILWVEKKTNAEALKAADQQKMQNREFNHMWENIRQVRHRKTQTYACEKLIAG